MASALHRAAARQPAWGYTIAYLSRRSFLPTASAILLFALLPSDARAQATSTAPDDAFTDGRWRAEFMVQAAIEAWNYNPSHEELYGLIQGISYGLRDGLHLIVRQRLYYASQRRNDSRVLALTTGLRGRVFQRGRTSVFLQFDVGISDAAVASPPGGTRFNYIAVGGGGLMMQMSRRVQAVAAMEVVHISNAGIAGPDRNPDIEAIGPSLGLSIGF